jgi:hypothetical protein
MIAVLRLNWYDEIIKWNSYTYGGIYSILTESQSLWTPNSVLANTAAKLDKIGDDWHYKPLTIMNSFKKQVYIQ